MLTQDSNPHICVPILTTPHTQVLPVSPSLQPLLLHLTKSYCRHKRFSSGLWKTREMLVLYQSKFKIPGSSEIACGEKQRRLAPRGCGAACGQSRALARLWGAGALGAAPRPEGQLGAPTAGTHSGALQIGYYAASFKCPKNASFLLVLIRLGD